MFDQVDTQALHRVRDRLVSARTRLICQMRAFCLEYGIPIRQGAGVFVSPSVVEAQTEFVMRMSPDGYLSFVNEAYCRYIGKSREDF